MLWIWFGLDGTGIQRSGDFHWLLGPSVMIAFAFLGNTLFLTILVSMLTNTFSNIAANATAEICYRRAVLTLETVKSDALFAYMPPFNIVAVFVFFPLKFVLSPRWFHKIHVTAVRFVNLPLLLLIAIAERRLLSSDHHHHRRHGVHEGGHAESQAAAAPPPFGGAKHSHTGSSSIAPHYRQREQWWSWFWPEWSSHRDIRSVFDLPPPEEVHDEIAVDDELTHHLIRRQFTRTSTADMAAIPRLAPPPSRPAAADSHGDSQDHSGGTASSTAPPSPRLRQRGGVPGGRRPNNAIPKSRRDSMFPGITSQALRESFVNDTDDTGGAGGADRDRIIGFGGAGPLPGEVVARLDGLEAAMARVEAMLSRLLPEDAVGILGGGEGGAGGSGATSTADYCESCSLDEIRGDGEGVGEEEEDEFVEEPQQVGEGSVVGGGEGEGEGLDEEELYADSFRTSERSGSVRSSSRGGESVAAQGD
jgi:hypothetical protein